MVKLAHVVCNTKKRNEKVQKLNRYEERNRSFNGSKNGLDESFEERRIKYYYK